MSDEFLLPGMAVPPAPIKAYRVFLALFPGAAAAPLHELAQQVRDAHGMRGRPRPVNLLHLTLHYFDDYAEVPDKVMQAAEMAAAKVTTMAPFEVIFDRVKSFATKPSNRPCVLGDGGAGANPALRELKQRLFSVLGAGKGERGEFRPHITLLYDNQMVAEERVMPVRWTVREMVLVRSHIGKSFYERYRSWPLQG